MTVKHTGYTPGPWTVRLSDSIAADGEQPFAFIGVTEGKDSGYRTFEKHVAQIMGWGFDYDKDEEQQANARLIADAPRLAERVERLETILRRAAIDLENRARVTAKGKRLHLPWTSELLSDIRAILASTEAAERIAEGK
jgi:hypothetical protein